MTEPSNQAEVKVSISFAEFLESRPPNSTEQISDLAFQQSGQHGRSWKLLTPDIQLHCASDRCGGTRIFHCTNQSWVSLEDVGAWRDVFLDYDCRNCKQRRKTYALMVCRVEEKAGQAVKYGEIPTFGPPVPSRVITLIGPDRDLFLSGRRAENVGLGIGAFAYYRRVIENQKGRIIEQIAKVAEKLGAKKEVLDGFAMAAKETQFTKAIEAIKGGLPEMLLIEGRNPLTLLHTALSEGLHDRPDGECLELAQDIRVVLTELAERMSLALKDEEELKTAVNRLLQRNTKGNVAEKANAPAAEAQKS